MNNVVELRGLPDAALPFLKFSGALRQAGFLAAPEQTQTFVASVGVLGPRSIHDVRNAAFAVYGPGPDRKDQFNEVFDSIFLGRSFAAPAEGEPEDMPNAYDGGDMELLPDPDEEEPSGEEATAAERLNQRVLNPDAEAASLVHFRRQAPNALPRRISRRTKSGKGRLADARRAFRDLLQKDGEISELPTRKRRQRQRRVLMLIDVSGSMKSGTDSRLHLAHALVQAGERVEIFTLGTRLTRITRALRHRNRDQALELASGLVADWDGGTRLGDALAVFLSVPRFASFSRGALTLIVSDGLERGGADVLTSAVEKLRGLSWALVWLSPLAADPAYRPETEAMRGIAKLVDRIGDGASAQALAGEILTFAKGAN
ncbi:MAG: VWA domain-containing protein [Pseudomonadota bacterium]